MSELVAKINKRNAKEFGPMCKKCELYSAQCRCLVNNPWKNRNLVDNLQKVYTRMDNNRKLDNEMVASKLMLGKDLHMVMQHIEMSGYTFDEILKYMHYNYEKL